jgi:hypothetical protein
MMERLLTRLSETVSPYLLAAVGLLLILSAHVGREQLRTQGLDLQQTEQLLAQLQDQSAQMASHYQALADLKAQDVNQFKEGMSNIALSRKALFESGLSLQEEKRLLEKQWEIMTTYLQIDPTLQRIFLMRGDQPLESYPIAYVPFQAFGGVAEAAPHVIRIVSKERFANPERGQSEMVNGKLQWEPPQVGTSVRSNALGEFVIFTNSHVILHGPPKNDTDHAAFPHLCFGLSSEAARKIYQESFIGTHIVMAPMPLSHGVGSSTAMTVSSGSLVSPVTIDSSTKGLHGN